MPKRVRADAELCAAQRNVPPDETIHTACREAPAPIVQEERSAGSPPLAESGSRLPVLVRRRHGAIFQPGTDCIGRTRVERYEPLLLSFTEYSNHAARQIHILDA